MLLGILCVNKKISTSRLVCQTVVVTLDHKSCYELAAVIQRLTGKAELTLVIVTMIMQ